jgi:pimeloyl-ACP methyl ester carboxylesterase
VTYSGDASRPPIVMLHEGLGSISTWRDFPQRVSARTGCSVVAYSRYGYGASDPLAAPREPDFMHSEAQDVLPELLAALQLERPVLFGHSDGASIALIYAGTHPHGARGLVLEAPHVFVEELTLSGITAAKAAWTATELRARLARHHADVDGAFAGWNDVWLDPRFRDWNIEAYADVIRIPVLVVQGDVDEYGTLAQVESIAARIPGTEMLIVPRAGHSPHRDVPDAVLDSVASFVARL